MTVANNVYIGINGDSDITYGVPDGKKFVGF